MTLNLSSNVYNCEFDGAGRKTKKRKQKHGRASGAGLQVSRRRRDRRPSSAFSRKASVCPSTLQLIVEGRGAGCWGTISANQKSGPFKSRIVLKSADVVRSLTGLLFMRDSTPQIWLTMCSI